MTTTPATPSVTLLGTKGGPAIRPGSSMPTATLVRLAGRTVLVDAGLGAARGVCAAGIDLHAIDLVVITHLHSDHVLELGPLLHTAWTAGLARPVPVIGPAGLADYWRHFLAAMAFDVELRVADEGRVPLAPLADIREIAPDATTGADSRTVWRDVGTDGLVIEAVRNHHPPIAQSYALRLSGEGRCIVLSGDTAPFEGWETFCRGADLLVHETMLHDGVEALIAAHPDPDPRLRAHILRSHTEAGAVGRLAMRAGVRALALNHFVPDGLPGFGPDAYAAAVRRHYGGPLYVGRDGMRIAL